VSASEGNQEPRTTSSGAAAGGGLADREGGVRSGDLNWRHGALAVSAVAAVLAVIYFWPGKKPHSTPIGASPVTIRDTARTDARRTSQAAQARKTNSSRPETPVANTVPPGNSATAATSVPPKQSPFKNTGVTAHNIPPTVPESVKSSKPPIVQTPIETPPRTPTPVPSPVVVPPVALNGDFAIEVLSRTNRIVNGSSFPEDDRQLGELALGDIKVMAVFSGQRLPKGRLTLEWVLDRIPMGRKPVQLGQLVEYAAEPTAGTYEVVLRLEAKVIQSFTFRITPAK
jgi:hypothetical protein